MKRIVKLKGELIISLCISTILGFIIAFIASGVYREITLTPSRLLTLATERNNQEMNMIKTQLDIGSKDESTVYKNLKRMEESLDDSYINRIFIVDNQGNVKFSTGKIGIREIDLSKGEGDNLFINNSSFTATNIIKLNENSYVAYLNDGYIYNDIIIYQIGITATLIIFLIFISGRVKYISSIAKSVKNIATGDFSNRVPLKYKNELTNLAEDINYMSEELQKQDLNQKEFITNISHDLRTPLTTILGYSKMLEEKIYSNEEELERYISIINNKGNYLKTMLDDFFHYAKLSSKDMELEKVLINFNELIMQLLDGEDINFKEKNLELQVKLESKTIHVHGDSMFIARALGNLINNTLKYSKEFTVVNINLKKENINGIDYGIFSIENTPINNISKDIVPKLFKRLYKVDKSRSEKGSGLGLVITQEIIKAHDGFIKASLIHGRIRFIVGLKIV